jgi:O-antigen ligase
MSRFGMAAGLDTGTRRVGITVAVVSVVIAALSLSFILGRDEMLALYAVGGLAIFLFSYLNTDFALSVLIFSMLLSPEFSIGGAGGVGQMAQRNVVIRIDDVVLGLITLSWLTKMAVNKDLGLFVRTPLNRPMYLYLILSTVSTLIGIFNGDVRPAIGMLYVVKYFQYFLIFLMVASHVRNMRQLDRFVRMMLWTAALVSIYAIILIPTGMRVTAPFEGEGGEANTLGGYLVLLMSLVIGLMTGAARAQKRWLYALLLVMMSVPLAYTLSRSSWIAMFPALVGIIVYSPKRRYVMIALILLMILLPIMLPSGVYERINATVDTQYLMREDVVEIGDVALDPSTSARILSWFSTLKQWTQKPIFGWGVTGAGFKDAQYFRVLVETGLLGFGAFVYLLISVQRLASKQLKRIDPRRHSLYYGLVVGFIGGYWGLLIHAIGTNTFIIVRIMEPFWFLAALVWHVPDMLAREEAREQEEAEIDPELVQLLKRVKGAGAAQDDVNRRDDDPPEAGADFGFDVGPSRGDDDRS